MFIFCSYEIVGETSSILLSDMVYGVKKQYLSRAEILTIAVMSFDRLLIGCKTLAFVLESKPKNLETFQSMFCEILTCCTLLQGKMAAKLFVRYVLCLFKQSKRNLLKFLSLFPYLTDTSGTLTLKKVCDQIVSCEFTTVEKKFEKQLYVDVRAAFEDFLLKSRKQLEMVFEGISDKKMQLLSTQFKSIQL